MCPEGLDLDLGNSVDAKIVQWLKKESDGLGLNPSSGYVTWDGYFSLCAPVSSSIIMSVYVFHSMY